MWGALRHFRSRHRLTVFLVRRVGIGLLLCLGVTLLAFVLTRLVPGNPAEANLGTHEGSNPAAVRAYDEKFGLDKPLPVQYGIYLGDLARGNMGISEQSDRPVAQDLAVYIPATAELAITSMFFSLLFGVTLGLISALRRNGPSDHALRVLSLGGMSIPPFWLAIVAILVFFYYLGWLPDGGRLDATVSAPPHFTGLYTIDALLAGQPAVSLNALDHLLLPALVLGAFNIGLFQRFTRSAVLEVLGDDYVRTARAKGLPERIVLLRHVLRAALPPIVTVVGLALANVLTGTVLVEHVFAWPGIGQYSYQSATTLDLPAIAGVMIFVAVVYIGMNVIVDVLHSVIDPRIRI